MADPAVDLYLFDDALAKGWRPFRLTRPVGELLYGCLLLRERAERFWDAECRGHLAGDELLGFDEADAPPVVRPEDVPDDRPRLLFSSRAVPEPGGGRPRESVPDPDLRTAFELDGEVVGWWLPAGAPIPSGSVLDDPRGSPDPGTSRRAAPRVDQRVEIAGSLLVNPWDLVAGNTDRIARDVPEIFPHSDAFLHPNAERIGDRFPVSLGHDVVLEPGVVLDTRHGPIRISDGVRVCAHTRLEGPAFIGRGCTVLGGNLGGVSIGPVCKVRGEIEETVILGYSNKAHDGFLGHAYLGRWVNLGAMTTNSDLKNNYGPVRMRIGDQEVDTGLIKLGCLLGDHVKTGIGTLLNTGTLVGAGANLFGGAMPPKYVPPFSWGTGGDLGEYRLDAFLDTAATVMGRRNQALTGDARTLLERAWEGTRAERRPDRPEAPSREAETTS